jgi:transposase
MPQALLRIKPHLTHEELTKRYRTCKNGREKGYWHIIWLMNNPKKIISVKEAAQIVGFCQRWARILVHRYNEEGPDNFIDKRKNNQGREAFLNHEQQEELKKNLIEKRPPDGGLWTGPKVALWIKKKTKKNITAVGAWKWIRKAGFTLQVPRPKNIKAVNKEETEEFKKKWQLSS